MANSPRVYDVLVETLTTGPQPRIYDVILETLAVGPQPRVYDVILETLETPNYDPSTPPPPPTGTAFRGWGIPL